MPPDPTWQQWLMTQGPGWVLVAAACVGFYKGSRAGWPWIKAVVERAFSKADTAILEAQLSREQRALELQADAKDKDELHKSFREAVSEGAKTARLLADTTLETARVLAINTQAHHGDVVTRLANIHDKLKDIKPGGG